MLSVLHLAHETFLFPPRGVRLERPTRGGGLSIEVNGSPFQAPAVQGCAAINVSTCGELRIVGPTVHTHFLTIAAVFLPLNQCSYIFSIFIREQVKRFLFGVARVHLNHFPCSSDQSMNWENFFEALMHGRFSIQKSSPLRSNTGLFTSTENFST